MILQVEPRFNGTGFDGNLGLMSLLIGDLAVKIAAKLQILAENVPQLLIYQHYRLNLPNSKSFLPEAFRVWEIFEFWRFC